MCRLREQRLGFNCMHACHWAFDIACSVRFMCTFYCFLVILETATPAHHKREAEFQKPMQ